ncbi:MAG: RNA ligase [Euryarchaeota archaeon]|jgi:putative ATP-dependent DNA ligase|nr:RNA ligase [Euryarchaeota archaeon]
MQPERGRKFPEQFFFEYKSNTQISLKDFIELELPEILQLSPKQLKGSFDRGNVKFYSEYGLNAIQLRKSIGHIEAGTMVSLGKNVEVIRGFPKIRRTLLLEPVLKKYFKGEIALEEKMNGYNVRIARINNQTLAFTRGGFICPYTTKKANELMDMEEFFNHHPHSVLCGEMVGTDNPYVSHYYPEIGKLGFRIFDVREKNTNQPWPILEKRKLLEEYGLPTVKFFGIYDKSEAAGEILDIVKKMGEEDREGVVMKDPNMKIQPLKYTSSQAHVSELEYAFSYPFDLGQAFFFSRVIREGFQSFEMDKSDAEIKLRAQRIGESILQPMLETIRIISDDKVAAEDLLIEVDSPDEAEDFARYLRSLGVIATVVDVRNGKAVIRRLHQSTSDKIRNFLNGGLY